MDASHILSPSAVGKDRERNGSVLSERMMMNGSAISRARGAAIGVVGLIGMAGLAVATSQIPTDRTITTMGAYSTGGYIVFTPAIPGLEGCTYSTGNQVWIDWQSQPDNKALYATALAAYLAGQKVGFGVNGCVGQLPSVYRIDVAP